MGSPGPGSSPYGDSYGQIQGGAGGSYGSYGSGYGNSYGEDNEGDNYNNGSQDDTPQALHPTSGEDTGELLNPMAALSLGPSSSPNQNYDHAGSSRPAVEEEDDADDLGFGNTALSRNRTPQPPAAAKDAGKGKAKAAPPEKADKAQPASSSADVSLSKGKLRVSPIPATHRS